MGELLNILVGFIKALRLWCIVDEYEEAGLFRRGRYLRTLQTGWHWIIPLVDNVEPVYVRPRVLDVGNMSLPTRDGKVIAASGNVEYEIVDTRMAILSVYERQNSIEGAARGIISKIVMETTYEDMIQRDGLAGKVLTALQEKTEPWGIKVRQFWFTELVPARVFRLLQDGRRLPKAEELVT